MRQGPLKFQKLDNVTSKAISLARNTAISLLDKSFNIIERGTSKFLKKYPALQEHPDAIIQDIKIHHFKKYPYAERLDERQHERGFQQTGSDLNFLIELLRYDGEITVKAGEENIAIPFSCLISDSMQNYLSNQSRVDKGDNVDTAGFLYAVRLGGVTNKLLFDRDMQKQEPPKNIIKKLDKQIIQGIFQHFNFFDKVARSDYRRNSIEVHNLPSMQQNEDYHENMLNDLKAKHELPMRIFYEKGSFKKVEKANKQGEYTNVINREKELIATHLQELGTIIGSADTFVDLGCFDGEKVFSIIRGLHKENGEYLGMDVNMDSLLKLGQTKSNINNNIRFRFNLGFLEFKDIDNLKNIGNKVLFIVGGSFGNLSEEERVAFLWKVRELLHEGESLILGVFLHDEQISSEDILKFYVNPEGEEFVLNGFQNAGIDRECIAHEVEYNEEDHTVYIYGRCKETLYREGNAIVPASKLMGEQKEVFLAKDTKILAFRSKRFTHEELPVLGESTMLTISPIATTSGHGIFHVGKKAS